MNANRQGFASNFYLPLGMVVVFVVIVIIAVAVAIRFPDPTAVFKAVVGFLF